MTDKTITFLQLLKDWSVWLVSLQTAALGLFTLFGGKEHSVAINRRWALSGAVCFAASIVCATWVLGAIPDILLRAHPDENPYGMDLFEWLPVRLWIFTTAEHWFFILGLILFVRALFSSRGRS